MTQTTLLKTLPDDFAVDLIKDDSKLPVDALEALRELAWRKATERPLWFVEQFWHVIDPLQMRWVKFKLRDYQREDGEWITESMGVERARLVVTKARQIGWTTLAAALALHDAWFRPNHPWLIASQTEDDAKMTLGERIRTPFDMLPLWMRARGPQQTNQNSELLQFDNGSWILSIPATSKAGRSKVVFGALLDEFAYVGEASGLLAAIDPLCYGPLIVFSTGNGMGNRFHQLVVEAQRPDSEWDLRFRPWSVVPHRNEKWYEREKRKYRGREWEFYQEYPSNLVEAFEQTGRVALPVDLLRQQQCFCDPLMRVDLTAYRWPLEEEGGMPPLLTSDAPTVGEEAEHELWVWELPTVVRDDQGRVVQQPNYVVACDVAEGLEHGDRTSIVVWNANTREVAATYLGYWPVESLGQLLEWVGYSYMTALLMPERNNHGLLPINFLQRRRYPRIYRMDFLAQIPTSDRTPRYGWHTNKATKPKMVGEMVKAIRDDTIRLHDDRLLAEAFTFVADGRGSYGAVPGSHDDHVVAHCIGLQGVEEVGRYPIVWQDDSIKPVTWAELERLGQPEHTPRGLSAPIGRRPKRVADVRRAFVI